MSIRFNVKLGIFRGADQRPIRYERLRVVCASALDACCRAEEQLNVRLPDNEYAAAYAVRPLLHTVPPSIAMPLPMAA